MRRVFHIAILLWLPLMNFAQEETRVIDSLQSVIERQEGREKVETMIELIWEFYEVSYDDCLDWGEKSIKEAQLSGFADLEARANYVLGLQYAYHGDLELANHYLKESYNQYIAMSDIENAFESLWDIATYELLLGNIDTAYSVYEKALSIAEEDFHYARACIYSNMGNIEYKKGNLEKAYGLYDQAKRVFEFLEDEQMTAHMEKEMACICSDRGQVDTARKMFWRLISKMKQYEDYCALCEVCQRLGIIYENEYVNYDSAMCYLQKSMDFSLMPMKNQEDVVDANNLRTEVLSEMANLMVRNGNYVEALEKYNEALKLAEDKKYQYGQMQAYIGLIEYYSQIGQAVKSLQYYEKYVEMKNNSGITMICPSMRKYLSMNYARLGRYNDLFDELESIEDECSALLGENGDLYEQIRNMEQFNSNILSQYESQNIEITTLKSQRNHYRLAFFGLLAIMLSALVLFVSYKIVRKNRDKIEKG